MDTLLRVSAVDGAILGAALDGPSESAELVIVTPAMGTPARFYSRFAEGLAEQGLRVLRFDYRGMGWSRPAPGPITMEDWFERDLQGVIAYAAGELGASRIHLVGHSLGGQLAGMLPDPSRVTSMVTVVAQNGYWRLQGGAQRMAVGAYGYLVIPVLANLTGRLPFRWFGRGENVPRRVALRWARWIRDPEYLFGDESLPRSRYADFRAPTLALSVEDDDWGTARSVDALMRHYPVVERRHLVPADHGLDSIGHFGFFRPRAEPLWREIGDWMRAQKPRSGAAPS